MIRKYKYLLAAPILAATILMGTMSVATAQIVVPWGNHDPGELGGTLFFGTGSSFPFEVVYTFSLSSIMELSSVAVTNDAADGSFDINGAAVRLYQSNGNANFGDDVLLGGYNFDDVSTSHTFSNNAAGSYFYKVTGQVDGPFGGSYLLSSHAEASMVPDPVPEPGSWCLLLFGLPLLGGMALRRANAQRLGQARS